jgi:beta-lactamase class A
MLKELKKLINAVFEMENNNKNLNDAEIDKLDLTELKNLEDFLCNYYNEEWDDDNVEYLMNLISDTRLSQEDRKVNFVNYIFN